MGGLGLLTSVARDFRLGLRGLRRDPAPLVVAVVCLGIGIGATTTLFGLVDGFLLRDVTARHPERLVSVAWVSYPTYRDLGASGVFEGLAAGAQCNIRWRDGDQTRAVVANCLSANFFEVVGGDAAIGRVFSPDEAAPEKNPHIVVLSDRFWRRTGGDPDIVGRSLTFNNVPFTVIGVLPPDYRAIQGYGISPDVFVPYSTALQPRLLEREAPPLDRMNVIGLLRRDRSLDETRQALVNVLAAINREFPTSVADPRREPPALAPVAGLAKYGAGGYDQFILQASRVMGAVVLMVLSIACANAAGLLLARGVSRRSELSVCLALGASRSQLVRQLLAEAILLAFISTVLGVAISYWMGGVIQSIDIPVQDTTVRLTFAPDWRLALAASAAGAVCAIGCGLLPALAVSRPRLHLLTGRGTTPRLVARSYLIVGQMAASVLLLFAALLFGRNLVTVLERSPGFDVSHTAWLDVAIDRRLSGADRAAVRDRLYRVVETSPGVEAVSWTWYLPYQVSYPEPVLRAVDGGGLTVRTIEQGVGPGYLATMRIPLIAGREFTWEDVRAAGRPDSVPVLVNEVLARALFPDRAAVGERVVRVTDGPATRPMTIVGVAGSTPFRVAGERPPPLLQSLSPYTPSFVVRTAAPPGAVLAEVSRAIDAAMPGTAGGSFPVSMRHSNASFLARGAAIVLSGLASVGLGMALVGLCGLVTYNVARRTREIAIRLAVGAASRHVAGLMLMEHLKLVAWGAGLGVLSAAGFAPLLSRFLAADVEARDPLLMATVLAGLLLSAAVAIWVFSRRVSRIAPAIAVRAE
jgi:predicted permease